MRETRHTSPYPAGRSFQIKTTLRTFTRRLSIPILCSDDCAHAEGHTSGVSSQSAYQDQSDSTSLIANAVPLCFYLEDARILLCRMSGEQLLTDPVLLLDLSTISLRR